jgi:type III secretion system HrpE/YscL family protein
MSFALLYELPAQGVLVQRKTLGPTEFAAVRDAQELLWRCKEQCDSVLASVEGARAAEKLRGYQEGKEEGLSSCAALLFKMEVRNAEYWKSHSERVAMLVDAALTRIVGDMDTKTLVAGVATEAVRRINQERRIVIKVHPNCVDEVRSSVTELLSNLPLIEQIDVLAAPEFSARECLIETPNGYVNASWDVQVSAIRSALVSIASDALPQPALDRCSEGVHS